MAQHGSSSKPPAASSMSAFAAASPPATSSSGDADSGVNAELLMSMMNCVDTSLFSTQQLHNWEQMQLRIKAAAEHNTSLNADVVQDFIVQNTPKPTDQQPPQQPSSTHKSDASASASSVDYRQPLHREASIQDVLACLLEQQAPTTRTMSSSGGSFLMHSENKNRAAAATVATGDQTPLNSATATNKPTLKSLLSSHNFTMTEKKESLRHLLSFIDNSFTGTGSAAVQAPNAAEPLTQVYKDAEEGTLQRLSSLQLMRSFMTPLPPHVQTMGRTTSFEIIQAMLNATTNHAIQKPMSSQDSFRFQHLARTLESIESDVGVGLHGSNSFDNDDYGGDDVVQVTDNLDQLLEYHGPTSSSSNNNNHSLGLNTSTSSHTMMLPPLPPHATTTTGSSSGLGFVDTQALVNNNSTMSAAGFPQQQSQQQAYSNYAPSPFDPSGGAAGGGAYSNNGSVLLKTEPQATSATTHDALQHQLLQQQVQQQQQHNPYQYQPSAAAAGGLYAQQQQQTPPNSMLLPNSHATDAQQFAAMMLHQQQQQQVFHPQHGVLPAYAMQQQQALYPPLQRIPLAPPMTTLSQVKQHKTDAAGGIQICSALGCSHPARVKGMCKLHGGGRRCKVDGCMKSAQTGHLCIAHGGGKPCNVDGCPKTAQSRGLCKQHGGGVRCKFEGCTKSCQSGGFCRGHGGGKRCEFPQCTKWAQKNGHCAKHAQELTVQKNVVGLVHP